MVVSCYDTCKGACLLMQVWLVLALVLFDTLDTEHWRVSDETHSLAEE